MARTRDPFQAGYLYEDGHAVVIRTTKTKVGPLPYAVIYEHWAESGPKGRILFFEDGEGLLFALRGKVVEAKPLSVDSGSKTTKEQGIPVSTLFAYTNGKSGKHEKLSLYSIEGLSASWLYQDDAEELFDPTIHVEGGKWNDVMISKVKVGKKQKEEE